MVLTRKTGTYFVEGLSTRTMKRIFSRNYVSMDNAIARARKWQKEGRIHQADIIYTKNILSDVPIWGLDTKGKVKRYNREKGIFEYYE